MIDNLHSLTEFLEGFPLKTVDRTLPELKPAAREFCHWLVKHVFISQQYLSLFIDNQAIYPNIEMFYCSCAHWIIYFKIPTPSQGVRVSIFSGYLIVIEFPSFKSGDNHRFTESIIISDRFGI